MYSYEEISTAIEHCLNENEQVVIKARLGIDRVGSMTLKEIESFFGVSRVDLREIEKKVLDCLAKRTD